MASDAAFGSRVGELVRRGQFRELGTSVLVVAMALLLSALTLLGLNVSTMRQNFIWVQQADDVLLQIWGVESGITGDEMSVRGFALTQDPRFLEYQKRNRQRTTDSMHRLGQLVAGDPAQSERYAKMRASVRAHMDYFRDLPLKGTRQVAAAIVSGKCRAIMNEIRAQLAAYRSYELQQLASRQALAARQASRTYALSVGIVIAAFLSGGLGVLLFRTKS